MNEFLTRVERPVTVMGNTEMFYNNLYFVPGNAQVLGRTEDGMYEIFAWQALEVDPRTGLSRTYSDSTLTDAGVPLGVINNSVRIGEGIIAKVSLIVPTSLGAEVTP